MNQSKIRNFCIVAHIDHGKSTLADRMLEITGAIPARSMQPQYLDKLPSERERGITIKMQTVRMEWQGFVLNLIDTPGHIDFSYEVSRALAACEGAILLVDATQGIQAQTLSNYHKAISQGLKIIPVINKIDLREAQIKTTEESMKQAFGFSDSELSFISAKSGEGVKDLLNKVVESVPAPTGEIDRKLRALVFDSFFDEHKGVIALVKIVDGVIQLNSNQPSPLIFFNSQKEFLPLEIGIARDKLIPSPYLQTGEVGYIATGIKDIRLCRVGDTITDFAPIKFRADKVSQAADRQPAQHAPTVTISALRARLEGGGREIKRETYIQNFFPLPGFTLPKPMVFADLYPLEPNRFNDFRKAIERLALNDASLTFEPTGSPILGSGFRGGFLGLLHLEITQERLSKEHDLEIFVTTPTAAFEEEAEPWVKAEIFSPQAYLGNIMTLCQNRRGLYKNTEFFQSNENQQYLRLTYELPFAELISDFYDELKSQTQGFASLDYEFLEYRKANLCRLDILINGKIVEPLSRITLSEQTAKTGRLLVEKLKNLIPAHQFAISLQAAVGGKIMARADISALRKNVLAKLSGGHRERKDKLLEIQKKGKEKMKRFGEVDIPQKAFLALLKK